MYAFLEVLGALVTLAGSVFLLLGGLGVLRMPDSYNRLQAGTKASTLGTTLALIGIGIGIGIAHPGWLGKLLILAFFVMLTSPISAHALARAAHAIRVPLRVIAQSSTSWGNGKRRPHDALGNRHGAVRRNHCQRAAGRPLG